MSSQNIDFKQPGTDGDTGESDNDSIRPFQDNEQAYASSFNRPVQNLRKRTEILRQAVEDLAYLADADRALVLRGGGSVLWEGPTTDGVTLGTFTLSEPLVVRSMLAPDASTGARVKIGGVVIRTITLPTLDDATPPRAYSGANKLQVAVTGALNAAISFAIDGTPADNLHLTLNNDPVGGTTSNQLITALMANPTFKGAGLEAVLDTGADGNAVIGSTYGAAPTLHQFAGAVDAEKHVIQPAAVAAFFTLANRMYEGDTLCIGYEKLVDGTYGGRRQSIDQAPENSANVDSNLFLLRRQPERQPGAIPVCTVSGGILVFVSGVGVLPGVANTVYTGSAGHPYAHFAVVGNRGQVVLGKDGEANRVVTKDDMDVVFGGGDASPYHDHTAIREAITNHLTSTSAHKAEDITSVSGHGVAANNVQAALNELGDDTADLKDRVIGAITEDGHLEQAAGQYEVGELRVLMRGYQSGEARDGEVIVFDPPFQGHPHVRLSGGLVHEPRAKWSGSDGQVNVNYDPALGVYEQFEVTPLVPGETATVIARLRQIAEPAVTKNHNTDDANPNNQLASTNATVRTTPMENIATGAAGDQYTIRFRAVWSISSGYQSKFDPELGGLDQDVLDATITMRWQLEVAVDGVNFNTGEPIRTYEINRTTNGTVDNPDSASGNPVYTEVVTVPGLTINSRFRLRMTEYARLDGSPNTAGGYSGSSSNASGFVHMYDNRIGGEPYALTYTTRSVERWCSKTPASDSVARINWEAWNRV